MPTTALLTRVLREVYEEARGLNPAPLVEQTSSTPQVVEGSELGFALEIAEAAGISADTERSHIKHIFVRTGLRRQVDLVRHVCLLAGIAYHAADDLSLRLTSIRSHALPQLHRPHCK